MPARLRPTAPIAADAILVGDPGRALMLAQELLEQPKMSNHARGLWGYAGRTHAGGELTIQSTGMGGPSASVVLADLVELGVSRAIRIGTCAALDERSSLGELIVVGEAHYLRGAGPEGGTPVLPDSALTASLEERLAAPTRRGAVASFDTLHQPGLDERPPAGEVADMQTATLLSTAAKLEVALAAVLLVVASDSGEQLEDEAGEDTTKRAGAAAAAVLST
jgi:uridine phosphorylase